MQNYIAKSIIILVLLLSHVSVKANSNLPDWMNSSVAGLSNLFSSCIIAPTLSNFNTGSTNISINSNRQWQSTSAYVTSGKLLKIDWNLQSSSAKPKKYLVLYRIDPRFAVPQVFIQTYDYTQNKYISDFHQFNNGVLPTYQTSAANNFTQRINDYNNYFNYNGRSKIAVNTGDVINITMASAGDFFNSNNQFTNELDSANNELSLIYTVTPSPDNKLIYTTASAWCNALTSSSVSSSMVCTNNTYKNTTNLFAPVIGKPYEPKFNDLSTSVSNPIPSCAAGLNTANLSNLCFYDHGRGMKILVNGQTVKSISDIFLANTNGTDFFYYKAGGDGTLDFATDWQIANMFTSYNQLMSNWGGYSTYSDYLAYINGSTLQALNNNTNQAAITSSIATLNSDISALNDYLNVLKNTLSASAGYIGMSIFFSTPKYETINISGTEYTFLIGYDQSAYDNFMSLSSGTINDINALISSINDFRSGLNSIPSTNYTSISSFLSTNFSTLNSSILTVKYSIANYENYLNQYNQQSYYGMLNLGEYDPLSSQLTNDISTLSSYLNSNQITYISVPNVDLSEIFLHFGRYFMSVEIGNGETSSNLSIDQTNSISVEYIISESTPSNTASGMPIQNTYRNNANQSGYLWFRVINPNTNLTGNININYAYYTGTTWFSDVIYNDVITPLKSQFSNLTQLFYNKLITNTKLQLIARTMLTLYISFYALFFLAGAVKISIEDIVTRIIKISLVIVLFSQYSWNFFNNNLFNVFISGTDYLVSNILDASSSVTNIFSFIDPILDRYTNPKIWALLFIQLLQFHNGLVFFAIMTIYALLLYFRAVIEVIIGYCVAFVGLSVMISLAPFFIILMLFERTRSIFDNWLSMLLDYVVQPTILLIFFLLIDQVMSAQLINALAGSACWECLIPLKITVDLNHISIPYAFSFSLPFLDCIYFYVPRITSLSGPADLLTSTGSFITIASSSLLFYAYSLMSYGLVEYISMVVSQLTNVTPARQEGDIQKPDSLTRSIMYDLQAVARAVTSTATAPIRVPARIFKDKILDQNFRAKLSKNLETTNAFEKTKAKINDDSKENKQASRPEIKNNDE